MATLRDLPRQLLTQWRGLPQRSRIGIIAVTALAALGLTYLVSTEGHVDYAPLFSGLSTEDASAIVDKLHEQKIPFQLSRSGEVIEVPRERVAETRLAMASLGLPRGGAVGYELFDKQGLGVSEFTQRINYHRALQGELERSILTLAAVQRARVHLVVPERNLFRTPEQQASASVVLQLRAGRTLLPQHVQGIVHLVAASVEGLVPERITVVDQRGEVLSQKSGTEAATTAALAYQRDLEQNLSQKAQGILERTLGRGHTAVQVSAQVDRKHSENTEEEFDPEQQVIRSEQEIDDHSGGAPGEAGTQGVAGARANLPGGPPPQPEPGAGTHRRSQTKNYEIGKVVRKTTHPVGRLERLTVAVLVDGTYSGEGKDRKFVPRGKEEMDTYAAIVRDAVGFDAKRGDQLEVRCVPFVPTADGLDEASVSGPKPFPLWGYGAAAAALALLMGGLVLHQLRQRKLAQQQQLLGGVPLPSSVERIEASLQSDMALSGPPDEALQAAGQVRQQALELIHSQPERAVQMLRAWINEPVEEGDRRREPNRT